MKVKSLTVNRDYSVTLVMEDGSICSMLAAQAGILREQYEKLSVRDAIRYALDDLDGDQIALGSYDGTTDEFIDEVFASFEDEIECGNHPDDDAIQDAIIDLANDYGILIDD